MTNVCGRPNHDSATVGSYCPTCQSEYRDRAYAAEAELNEWSAKFGRSDPSLVYGALSSALYALGQLGARRPYDDAANEIIGDSTTAIINVLRSRPSLTEAGYDAD